MTASGLLDTTKRAIAPIAALLIAALSVWPAQAQTVDATSAAQARVIVAGEGRITAAPDYARISSGATSNAKTVKEASDAIQRL